MMLWLSMAFAGCDALPIPPDSGAVAWLSPVRKGAGRNTRLRVIPVSTLKSAKVGSVARLLQLTGYKKKARPPRKEWKVTIFQASSGALCRPIEGAEPEEFVDGLPVCRPAESRSNKRESGCGTTVDRASDTSGVPLYRGSWSELAAGGFCVLPLERFVKEL